MKPSDSNSPLVQTINECPQRPPEPSLAHSKGKPGVSSTKTNISVRFATPLIAEIQVHVVESGAGWQKQAWLLPLLTLTVPASCEHCPSYYLTLGTNANNGRKE
jgi:hypothetical protein